MGYLLDRYRKPLDNQQHTKTDMPIIADNSKKNYPPKWSVYDQYLKAYPASAFGFVDRTKPNRFAARYRAAKCFKSVEFEYLNRTTVEGYSVLCKTLLTYSAFEYFLQAADIKPDETDKLLSSNQKARVAARLRVLDRDNAFTKLLHTHTRRRTKKALDDHLMGKICNPLEIAAAIRHTFAHGILTANPKGIRPQVVVQVCNYMIHVLSTVMDREVEKRMSSFIAAAGLVQKK
jgi:hypothetical protein